MDVAAWVKKTKENIAQFYLGNPKKLDWLLVAFFCGGHVLLEDVPGVGKTLLALTFSRSLGLGFNRIQCTPDLTPSDILGFSVYNPHNGEFVFRQGPVEVPILLVDEINRATPRTQSALLEAMAEAQISVEGKTRNLPEPFFLIATENPIEFEGTFPLPEAQKDRFFLSFSLGYPSRENEKDLLLRAENPLDKVKELEPGTLDLDLKEIRKQISVIRVDSSILDYVMDFVERTRNHSSLELGSSPRGGRALVQASRALALIRGRNYVLPDDIKELIPAIFRKRIVPKTSALVRGRTAEKIILEILEDLQTPALRQEE